jgi:hypothetical protein
MRNEEVLHRVKEERNILHTVKRRKAKWIGHILHRNRLLKHVTEGKVEGRLEVTGRQGRRLKQLLYDLKETKGTGNERESARLHCGGGGDSLWNGLWTCRKAME